MPIPVGCGVLRSGVIFIASSSFCDVWIWPVTVIAVVGVIAAVLLRWAGIRRPGVAAGLTAGLLCGLTVFGSVFPDYYKIYFRGGVEEEKSLTSLEEQQRADLLALTSTGASAVATEEMADRHREELEQAKEEFGRAVWEHGRGLRTIGLAFACFVFGLMWPAGRKVSTAVDEGRARLGVGSVDSWSDAFFVQLWMLVFVTGFVGTVMLLIFQRTRLESLAVGLSFALPSVGLLAGSCAMNHEDDDAGLPLRIARIGWGIGLVVMIGGMMWMSAGRSDKGLSYRSIHSVMVVIAFGALVLGYFLHRGWFLEEGKGSRVSRISGMMSVYVLVPVVTAILCLSIDLKDSSLLWPVAIGMVVGGDGRWFGAACGMRVAGAGWRRAMRRALYFADGGILQVIIGFVLWMTGVVSGVGMIGAMVAGAVVSDITVDKRKSLLLKWQEEMQDVE